MILRKPYAFIIKHFRLIHLIIFASLLFILYNTLNIHDLLTSLQKSNTYIYEGANVYIDYLIYFFIAIVLFLSGIIFWLLREKKKPTKLYLFLFIYLITLSLGYIYIYSFLNTLQYEILDVDSINICRDITFLLTLPTYVFLGFCFIRGIGFNIKQFNFSKDIKELQIAKEDSEEFELLIGQNNYKYMRTFRRAKREIKYYFLENKFAFCCIFVAILAFLLGFGIYYYNQYMKKLDEKDVTMVNSISYIVNRSYITAYDYNGNKVKDGYKYIVLDMKYYNSSSEDKSLNLDLITLIDDKIVYYPTLNRNGKFYDLGVPYSDKQIIKSYEELEATLTFEIPEDVKTNNFTLRVQYNVESHLNKIIPQYRQFAIKAKEIDKEETVKISEIEETIAVNVVDKNKFFLTITNYKLMDSYNYRYAVCNNSNCRPLSKIIKPSSTDKETMLVLDYKGTIYEGANFTKTFDTYNKIFENYVTINYSINNKNYKEKAKVVAQNDIEGKVFLLVDRSIYKASEISVVFNFRNDDIKVPLKKKTA